MQPVSRDAYFWIIFLSQTLAMFANPIVTSVVPEVSSAWFAESERAIASSVGSLATLVGLAAGYSMSGFIIGSYDVTPANNTLAVTLATDQSSLAGSFQWLFVSQGEN